MSASTESRIGRIELIDLTRGLALVAMAIYHFTWDLEFFGYLQAGITGQGPLKWFARSIASSFLILVGISLILAHHRGIRWRAYLRRITVVAVAAAAITVATYFFTPDTYVFFGILHHIAVASLLALIFLQWPAGALVAIAALWFIIGGQYEPPAFSDPALLWAGLSPVLPRSNDYVPLFPWFGMVLLGMALAKASLRSGVVETLAQRSTREIPGARGLRFIGRHSLITYLVHQPVLIAIVFVFSLVFPAPEVSPETQFMESCARSCSEQSGAEYCTAFCSCAVETLSADGLFESVYKGEITQESDPRVAAVSQQCSFEAGANGN
ncbi:heparan-alpha-glucosaminide N-acetyltransferase [Oricola cellulosilytica]|uniref:DUF1624 domain-containing protein n=1 Tax=Oricola cellulosilytica TaxID=1429082 RepID=A0A4R0P886_9HYPH|nr:DUF1624 domain-containing protein [Oricola cellulosilytica]TCD13240.1 DUF1624 domain-containing protein [Oricola cellulosilytica]